MKYHAPGGWRAHAVSLALSLCMALPAGVSDAAEANSSSKSWNFEALLDGAPIGTHQFEVVRNGNQIRVNSSAEFRVKLLGITVYRYTQKVQELWRDGCLIGLQATTNDNGTPLQVSAEMQDDGLLIQGPEGKQKVPRCVYSYAYWNPDLLQQTELLNPQTGKLDALRAERISGSATGTRWRLNVKPKPIDIWLNPEGEWQSLEAVLKGGQLLRYRLL